MGTRQLLATGDPAHRAVSGRWSLPTPHPVGVAVFMAVVATFPAFCTGALGVELRHHLNGSVGQLGFAVSSFFFVSAALSTFLGGMSERFGPALVVRVGSLIIGVSLGAIALVASSFTSLMVCLSFGGIGHSLIQPALNGILARRVGPGRLGLAFGLKQSAIPLSVLISGISVPLVALTFGWRGVYGAAALVALGCAMSSNYLVPFSTPKPVEKGSPDMPRSRLAALGVAAGIAAMGGNALAVFLVSAAVGIGFDQAAAGLLLAAGSVAAVLVRIVAGFLVDRSTSDGFSAFVLLAAVGSLGMLLLLSSERWLFVTGCFVAFAGAYGWPGLFNYAVVVRNPHSPAAASGVTQAAVSFGAALGPLLFGALAGAASLEAAVVAMSGLGLVGASLAELARRRASV